MKYAIEVNNLTKSYKELKAVDDLSFKVEEGEILGLLGPNGSGKTTTINCMLSLLSFQSGSIKIFNQEMSPSAYAVKEKLGVVFQEVAVFDELSVFDNINYFCGLYIKDKVKCKQYVNEAIQLVGLENFVKFSPKKLSGGLLRRLNIACGIAHKPKLIFLDEPTVAVDPQSRNNILENIDLLRKNGATIVYTTHYMEEVELLCDRVIILDKGKVIASGTCDELKGLVEIEEKIVLEQLNVNDEFVYELRQISNVEKVDYLNNELTVYFKNGKNNILAMMDLCKQNNINYDKIYSQRPTLNDVFLKLTGKELRD